MVLVSASTGLPVAESLASHVEKLLTTTVQDCILFDSDGQEVPSENLVEACLLPRASAASMSKVQTGKYKWRARERTRVLSERATCLCPVGGWAGG